VDRDYVFPNPANPFEHIFPESKSVQNMQSSNFTSDFTAMKMGDVNNSAAPNATAMSDDRTAGTLLFDVEDRDLKRGEEVEVTFKSAQTVAAYQFTLNLNGLSVLEVVANDKVSAGNFGLFADAVTVSLDAAAFTLRFRADKAGKLSEMLAISNRITKAEAYKTIGNSETVARWDVAMRFNGSNGSFIAGTGFELLQNTPNPVSGVTSISFNLPEAAPASLTITNVEGRVLKTIQGSFTKGYNTVVLQRAELEAGVLFYQLNSTEFSATKKMIVIE
jgi:hypothetical protein